MPITKTGINVEDNYCRKCMKTLPTKNFYECVDSGFIDANGLFSVCKGCMQDIYDIIFADTQNLEKTIHKICTTLNIKYSNEAASATNKHIETIVASGKMVHNVVGVYFSKLVATNKSMNKSAIEDNTYSDVGTIYVTETPDVKKIAIPQETIDFWGSDVTEPDIIYLENEYMNFKKTHKADAYAEIVLLKQVCFTLLNIKKLRAMIPPGDSDDAVKELQALMKNLAISPNAANANNANKGSESFGLWIADIEREEPAEYLLSDPRGDIYRDVGNTDEYFQKYMVRPLRNFILSSKDFNVEDDKSEDDIELDEGTVDYGQIDDGEVE